MIQFTNRPKQLDKFEGTVLSTELARAVVESSDRVRSRAGYRLKANSTNLVVVFEFYQFGFVKRNLRVI